ncbi:MAG: hypothetical protein EB020_16080 [Proteobacteria bacterium]|nr:hypothetical protein [Pseudomonadota bacterium]
MVARAEREARKQRDFATQQAHIARTEAFIRRYRAGVKARQARGRQKQLDRLGRVGPPRTQGQMNLAIRATLRAGDTVLAFENLGIAPEAPVGNGLLGQTPGMPFVHESNASHRAVVMPTRPQDCGVRLPVGARGQMPRPGTFAGSSLRQT